MDINNLPAADRVLVAARIRSEAEENSLIGGEVSADLARAETIESAALALLPSYEVQHTVGGEIAPKPTLWAKAAHYKDTAQSPSLVTAEASRARLDLASEAKVLETTLDLCETVGVENSAERMLAGQMALMHRLIMKTGQRADEACERLEGVVRAQDREAYTVQLNRLVGTMARASSEFQNGLLTLNKIRSGGKQNITVTHVQNTQVNSGGQAVVTGGPVSGGLLGTPSGGLGAQAGGVTNGNNY